MIASGKRRTGLADFLKSRRARLRPEQFDLPTFPHRRAHGLRREELAQLVGVGVSWYTWLEQGRNIQVSDQVLERLASILQLNKEEHHHLFLLARDAMPQSDELASKRLPERSPSQSVLDGFVYPARLFDHRLNVIGWNESARRVFDDYTIRTERERNATWFPFMHPDARTFLVNWELEARRSLAFLRAKYDQYPDDAWLTEMVAYLQQASPEFRAWWPEHDILLTCGTRYEINHPQVGRLVFQPTVLAISEQPDTQMVVYTPLPQEDTAARLSKLMAGDKLVESSKRGL